MIERMATGYDDRIYTKDWQDWCDPDIPEWLCPTELLIDRHVSAGNGDRTAVLIDEVRVSYGELKQRVEQTSSAIGAAGCHPGERILLFATDSLDYVCVWLGAVRMGLIPVVVSDLYKADDLLYFLNDTGAATLFIDQEQIAKLSSLTAHVPEALKTVIIRGSDDTVPLEISAQAKVVALDALIAAASVPRPAWRWHREDVCYMFYSGGTTGKAKGITHLAHDFVLVPARQGAFWEYGSDDVVFATSRKYFTHGLWPGVLIPLAYGAAIVLDRRPSNPGLILELLSSHAVTKFITVPTILKNMIQFSRGLDTKPDLGKVELVISASEKISPEVFDNFEDVFGLEILDSIGSSEITYEWIANRRAEHRRGSLGKPVFGYEIRLVDNDGQDVVTPNVPGEAWVKSRTSCLYYWRKLDKSRETFMGAWTRTGDNLYFDEDGFFWFSGRDNDVFKVKGLWVSPIEIEAAISAHEAVLEAAVVSYEDGSGLTKPRCYVVLDQGWQPDLAALIEELMAKVKPLGGYKIPEQFRFVKSLPRTTLMKIDRRALRENPDGFI